MARIDSSLYDYMRFSKFKPILDWDDIKAGETYHIPPTIIYDRRDFVCEEVTPSHIKGRVYEYETKKWSPYSIYQTELSRRFLVKKEVINTKH